MKEIEEWQIIFKSFYISLTLSRDDYTLPRNIPNPWVPMKVGFFTGKDFNV